jgi:ribosome-associated protein
MIAEERIETTSTGKSIKEALLAGVRALDDKKAEKITALYLGPLSSVADYFVIASGTSAPHLRALRIAAERAIEECGVKVLASDTDATSGWVVVDGGEIIFHFFTPKMRELYALEKLWKDAKIVDTGIQS